VGDRADTDLDGAHRLGWSTALVLSGVVAMADLPDLAVAPDHLLADVGGLLDPPGPAIREATPPDTPAATALLATCQDAAAADPAATPTPAGGEPPRAPRHPAGAAPAGATLVAVDGAGVVGAVAWRRRGGTATITGPVVEGRWRGRLVGTRLLVAACVAARAAGLRRVAATGHGFLARLGFHPPEPEGPAPPGPKGPDGLLVRDLRDLREPPSPP
jgi:HAD-hyrolase-like